MKPQDPRLKPQKEKWEMGMIKVVTVYETKGERFATRQEAVLFRENLINKFLVQTPGYYDIPLKMRIAFMDSILSRRKELIDLLSYEGELDDND
jgi:hypothetical protein